MSSLLTEALATSHDASPHRNWFTTYDSGSHGCVHLRNNYACDIVGAGDNKFSFANLKNVRHVPKLTKSLISAGQLDDSGY